MTNFLDEHPGGKKILQRVLGKDASKQFWKYHNEKILQKYNPRLKIGTVGASDKTEESKFAPAPIQTLEPKYSPPRPKMPQISTPPKIPGQSDGKTANEIFGEVWLFMTALISAYSLRGASMVHRPCLTVLQRISSPPT